MHMCSRWMFRIPALAAVVITLACGPAHGRPSPGAPAAPAAQGTLGPALLRLNALAGHWSVRQSMWTDPAKPPAVDRGEAIFTPVLGGRHLRQELRIDSPRGTFHGLGYLGYDGATHRYDSLWMDVNFTGMILAHGAYDPSAHVYELKGAMPDPHHAGTVPLREVMRWQDADHFSYEYYEQHEGREMLAVRLEYARSR